MDTSALLVLALVVLVVSTMLYLCREWLAFNWRTIFFYVYTSFFSLLGIPYFLLRPCNPINCTHWTQILRLSTYIVGIKWEVRGLEILAQRRGCVSVANHQSSFDVLGMFWFWRWSHLISTVAKKEIFYAWPFGLAAWLAGVVFIDRLVPEKAIQQLEHAAKLMAKDNVKLWIFPEGTRYKKRCIMPFKKGAFHVAIACQAPIMPVVFSPYYFINPNNKYHTGGKVIITALPYVETKGLTMADVDDLIFRVKSQMEQVYKEMGDELKADLPPDYPGLEGYEEVTAPLCIT